MEQFLKSTPESTPQAFASAGSEPPFDVVPGDLECRRCGYNLRSLCWSSVCPECATLVEASRLPVGCQLRSMRQLRSVRFGLICFCGGVLLAIMPFLIMQIVFLYSEQLPRADYRWVSRWAIRIWAQSPPVGPLLISAGGFIVVRSLFAGTGYRSRWLAVLSCIVMATAGLVEVMIVLSILYFPVLWVPGDSDFHSKIGWTAFGLGFLCLSITTSIFSRREGFADRATWYTIMASFLIAGGSTLELIRHSLYSTISNARFVAEFEPLSLTRVDRLALTIDWLAPWWRQHASAAGWIIILLCVWGLHRRLRISTGVGTHRASFSVPKAITQNKATGPRQ